MLTGELPGSRLVAPSRIVHVDVRFDEIVLRALEKNPEMRYQQASIFKTQVETIAGAPIPPGGNTPPPFASSQDDAAAKQQKIEAARRAVAAPAMIGLRVVGLLNLVVFILMLLSVFWFVDRKAVPSGNLHPVPQPAMASSFGIVPMFIPMALYFSAAFLLLLGAINMRRLQSYGMAITACIVAMITPPGLLLGLPLGIWALIILSRPEVRDVFDFSEPPPKPRWPRRKLIGIALRMLGVAFAWVAIAYALFFTLPRYYSSRCTVEIKASPEKLPEVESAFLKIVARHGNASSLAAVSLRNTNMFTITASSKDRMAAAELANATAIDAQQELKTMFGNTDGMNQAQGNRPRLEIWSKAEPARYPSTPNAGFIVGITLFLALPFLVLPGLIMLLVGLFRSS